MSRDADPKPVHDESNPDDPPQDDLGRDSPLLVRALATGAAKDPVLRVAIPLWMFAVGAILLPLPTSASGKLFPAFSAAFAALALWAIRRRRSKIQLLEERRFWDDLRVAFGGRLIADLLSLALHATGRPALGAVAESIRALSYIGFFIALERRPELEGVSRPSRTEQRVIYFSGILFICALFLELRLLRPTTPSNACLPALFLGAYFLLMFLQQSWKSPSPRWKFLRAFFVAAFALEVAAAALCVADSSPAARAALLTTAAACFLLGIRLRHFRFPEAEFDQESNLSIPIGQTMVVALLFPLIHFGQNAFVDFQEQGADRQILLIAALLIFAPLALTQHRFLERRTLDLRRERERTERALRRSERKIHLMIQRRKNEETVRRSEEKFTRVFRSAPEVMVISGLPDGTILDINRDAELVLGYHRDELVGQSVPELAIWSDPADRAAMLEELRREGAIFGLEVEFRTKSGELRLGILSAQTSEIDGRPCLISVLRNVTQSRRDADRQAKQLALLRRSRSPVWILDPEGEVVFWNSAAERVYEIAEDDVRGRKIDQVFPQQASEWETALRTAANEGSWSATLPLGTGDAEVYVQWIFAEPTHIVFSDLAPDADFVDESDSIAAPFISESTAGEPTTDESTTNEPTTDESPPGADA